MELTPEERRQIYEEEKAKERAQQNLTRTSWLKILLILVAVVGITIYALNRIFSSRTASVSNGNTQTVAPSTPALPGSLTANPTPAPSAEQPAQTLSASIDKALTYERLKKNADQYIGQAWECTGRIVQIQEYAGKTEALLALDSWANKTVHVEADFTTQFVENDWVSVVGTITGNYSYTSVAGWNLTVPGLKAESIAKAGRRRR